jgi:hypothetical protein
MARSTPASGGGRSPPPPPRPPPPRSRFRRWHTQLIVSQNDIAPRHPRRPEHLAPGSRLRLGHRPLQLAELNREARSVAWACSSSVRTSRAYRGPSPPHLAGGARAVLRKLGDQPGLFECAGRSGYADASHRTLKNLRAHRGPRNKKETT